MSYKGAVLRGEKYAYTMSKAEIEASIGSIKEDYELYLASKKKVKEKK